MTQLTLFPGFFPDPNDPISPEGRAAAAHAAYRRIREHLRRDVVGHDHVVDRLAVVGVQHQLGQHGQRVLLVGPSGVGKSTLARSLARALQLPFALIDVAELAETNWQGAQLADAIADLWAVSGGDEDRMSKAVVLLDELDKIALAGSVAAGRDYRRGKQQSLLSLLGGAEVRYQRQGSGWRDRDAIWSAKRALVVGAGVFSRLPQARDPSPADFVRLGLMHELVERLGFVMRLAPLDSTRLVEVLRRGMQPAHDLFTLFGFELDVSEAVLSYVASAVARGDGKAGPRSGVSWLLDAAHHRLAELLNANAPVDTRCILSPDDVHLPGREEPGSGTRGRGRGSS